MAENLGTHEIFGMSLPVIAVLTHGFKLVFHKNGPCIATDHSLYTMSMCVCIARDIDDPQKTEVPLAVPLEVMEMAMEKFIKWCWPHVRHLADQ